MVMGRDGGIGYSNQVRGSLVCLGQGSSQTPYNKLVAQVESTTGYRGTKGHFPVGPNYSGLTQSLPVQMFVPST